MTMTMPPLSGLDAPPLRSSDLDLPRYLDWQGQHLVKPDFSSMMSSLIPFTERWNTEGCQGRDVRSGVCVCFALATFACSPACHVLSRRVSGIQGLWTSYSDCICEVWHKGWQGWCPSVFTEMPQGKYMVQVLISCCFLWIWYEFHCFLSFGSELEWQLWKCSKHFLRE